MRSSIKGGLKLCAFYIAFVAVLLALAFFSGEKTGGIYLSLAFFPGLVVILFGCLGLFECVNFAPVSIPWGFPREALLVCVCLLTVFVAGFVFTAIKNRLS
jgi:hypothetical protein